MSYTRTLFRKMVLNCEIVNSSVTLNKKIYFNLVGCNDKNIYLCDLKSGSNTHTLKGSVIIFNCTAVTIDYAGISFKSFLGTRSKTCFSWMYQHVFMLANNKVIIHITTKLCLQILKL